jgi:hypothetical protein
LISYERRGRGGIEGAQAKLKPDHIGEGEDHAGAHAEVSAPVHGRAGVGAILVVDAQPGVAEVQRGRPREAVLVHDVEAGFQAQEHEAVPARGDAVDVYARLDVQPKTEDPGQAIMRLDRECKGGRSIALAPCNLNAQYVNGALVFRGMGAQRHANGRVESALVVELGMDTGDA